MRIKNTNDTRLLSKLANRPGFNIYTNSQVDLCDIISNFVLLHTGSGWKESDNMELCKIEEGFSQEVGSAGKNFHKYNHVGHDSSRTSNAPKSLCFSVSVYNWDILNNSSTYYNYFLQLSLPPLLVIRRILQKSLNR